MTAMSVEREEADTPVPTQDSFSISEAALFLGRSTQWVRWRSEQLEEEHSDFEVPRAENGYRRYTLDVIQRMADLLRKSQKISKAEHAAITKKVDSFRPKTAV